MHHYTYQHAGFKGIAKLFGVIPISASSFKAYLNQHCVLLCPWAHQINISLIFKLNIHHEKNSTGLINIFLKLDLTATSCLCTAITFPMKPSHLVLFILKIVWLCIYHTLILLVICINVHVISKVSFNFWGVLWRVEMALLKGFYKGSFSNMNASLFKTSGNN